MKPEVLITGPLMPFMTEALERRYVVHKLYEAENRDALLKAVGPRIRGVATGGHHGPDAALIDALPKLEIISSFGVGTDSIDVAHAQARGIVVCNTPDVLNDEVANFTIALLLAVQRKIVVYDRYIREGRWLGDDPPLTRSLAGSKIGMVGMGRIGRTIAEKLAVFHTPIAYFARNKRPELPYRHYSDLVALAKDSDVLIVIVPGGKETEKLVNRAVIDALGPEGVLVNVARGPVVDEDALVAALKEGRLGGAGLDVFAREPHVPPELFALDNVVLAPHQGSATVETRRAMGELVLKNLEAYFNGEKPPTPLP
jgi:lactate dehydrogenase-like 2-hydroxyacid dehydrogenase